MTIERRLLRQPPLVLERNPRLPKATAQPLVSAHSS